MKWSGNDQYETPEYLKEALRMEFGCEFDPCPIQQQPLFDGLSIPWSAQRVFVNPPWSRIDAWVDKALKREAEIVVFVLPARTDTPWFHRLKDNGAELRFFRKRVNFLRDGQPTPTGPTDGTLVAVVRAK